MQHRLLNFFAAVRNQAPHLKWSFALVTDVLAEFAKRLPDCQ